MRKSLSLILIMCLGLASAALAGDLASPAQMLKAGQFSLGVTGTWQAEQKFKDADLKANNLYSDGVREITSTRLVDFKIKDDQFYLATLTYGLSDCLNIFARVGLANGGKEQYTVLNPARSAAVEIKLKDALTWGLGAKGRLFETAGGLGATLSVQYLRYDNRKEETLTVNGAPLPLDTFDYQAEYQQVELVAALYQKVGCFAPYVGLGYDWAQFKYSGTSSKAGDYAGSSDFSATNQDNLAALLGLDVTLGSNFTINLQGSLVSQSAASLGFTYLF